MWAGRRRNTGRQVRWNHHTDTKERWSEKLQQLRGIILLSVPGNIMCSIILDRIKGSVEGHSDSNRQVSTPVKPVVTRSLHSDSRRSRNQLQTTCQLYRLPKSVWLRPPILWNIMKCYGIPIKIIDRGSAGRSNRQLRGVVPGRNRGTVRLRTLTTHILDGHGLGAKKSSGPCKVWNSMDEL